MKSTPLEQRGIPVYIISYNQPTYLRNMVQQLLTLGVSPSEIIIVDNKSTLPECLLLLEEYRLQKITVYSLLENLGHKAIFNPLSLIDLPEVFALTDPDLELPKNLPRSFRNDLLLAAEQNNVWKAGLALDISSTEDYLEGEYFCGQTIPEWESQFWQKPCGHLIDATNQKKHEVYAASIDTTFAVYRRDYPHQNFLEAVRVAGDFTACHLPWLKQSQITLEVIPNTEIASKKLTPIRPHRYELEEYRKNQRFSTTANLAIVTPLPPAELITRPEDNLSFYISKSAPNLNWWKQYFCHGWEANTFSIFREHCLSSSGPTTFIDIGSWIGTTALWWAQRAYHVICVEADKESQNELRDNIRINHLENKITLVPKAFHYQDDIPCSFGPEPGGKLNNSTSRLILDQETPPEENYQVTSISISSLVKNFVPPEAGHSIFIKCDIEGSEQISLSSLLKYISENPDKVRALFVSFHITWWKDELGKLDDIVNDSYKNFKQLNEWFCQSEEQTPLNNPNEIIIYLRQNPFGSILWTRPSENKSIVSKETPISEEVVYTPNYYFTPHYLSNTSTWVAHLPFAYDLIKVFKPSILVELGTANGDSFFTFCQAVKDERSPTTCYAIDHWLDDEQTSTKGSEQYHRVLDHKTREYNFFAHLIRSDFMMAINQFEDNSIDLCHIDGNSTYESTKLVFETWFSKIKSGGILLIHDILVRSSEDHRSLDVWRLWNELQKMHICFQFTHGCGLGVVIKGENPTMQAWLTKVTTFPLRHYYIQRGNDIMHRINSMQAFTKEKNENQILNLKLKEKLKIINKLQKEVKKLNDTNYIIKKKIEDWNNSSWLNRAFHRLRLKNK